MRKNVWVPLVSAGAVGAVLVGGAVISGGLGGSDDANLPTLAIGSGSGTGSREASLSADSSAMGGGAAYVLEGTLPEGPAEASVQEFTAGDVDARRASVASALGVDPANPSLSIATDATGSWSYSDSAYFETIYPTCAVTEPALPVPPEPDASTSSSTVAIDPCIFEQPELPGGPTEDKARSIAEPVLDALGVPTDDLRIEIGAPTTWVSVDPVVDGLPTRGIATSLEVSVDGVVGGNGFLGTTEPGEAYPLISAQEAYDQLANQPMPEIAMLCPEPAPLPEPATADDALVDPATDPAISMPCGYFEPTVITGAELGLTLQYDSDQPLLVPSWLFNPDEQYGPSMVAIDPAFISEPEPVDPDAPVEGGGSDGGSGSSPGSPGTVEPAPPVAEPAPAPIPDPSPNAIVDGATIGVVWTDSSSCVRTLEVESQTTDTVALRLSALPEGMVCTADAVPTKGSVTLDAPLAARSLTFEGSPIPIVS